jgi:glycosyltransferase involved in cell wall biosynthesis
MLNSPTVSVIIPSHNRSASLLRLVAALAKQDYPRQHMEVIVVVDGCTDDTVEAVRRMGLCFVRVIEQTNAGAGGARNAGATEATGELLVFLDDDIEAAPQLVGAHVDAHRRAPCQPSVVIGYCPVNLSRQTGWFGAALMHWWELMFDRMAQPGRRFAYTDLISGNFSLPKAFFMASGGFDATFRCHEDYELGFRLLRQGAAFIFARAALGHHHECSDLRRSLARKRDEGRADVRLGLLHPALIATLPLSRPIRSIHARLLRDLATRRPAAGRAVEALLWHLLTLCDRLHARRSWERYCSSLMYIHYWRGIAQNADAYERIFADRTNPFAAERGNELDLDLGSGIAEAEARLNASRPMGMRIRYGNHFIGRVPADPLRERLHARHLRSFLVHQFSGPLLMALDNNPTRLIDDANRGRFQRDIKRRMRLIMRGARGLLASRGQMRAITMWLLTGRSSDVLPNRD